MALTGSTDDTAAASSTIHGAARVYTNQGWALVALHDMTSGRCSCGNPDADPDHDRKVGGKHPRFRDWTTNPIRSPTQLQARWNVGIVTGAASGIWVADYDPGNADERGRALFDRMRREIGPATVRTGGGGGHWYLRLPASARITNSRGELPAGWDVRGDGGQVVAPPSISGKGAYLAEAGALTVYDPPQWLLDIVQPPRPPAPADVNGLPMATAPAAGDRGPRYAWSAVVGICDELAGAPEGMRETTAFNAACRLHELANAPWAALNRDELFGHYLAACGLASENGATSFSEAEAVDRWHRGQRQVAGKMAELPPDLLSGEVLPPLRPGPAAPTVLDATLPGQTGSIERPSQPVTDPFENAVLGELSRMAVRDEARRRHEQAKLGDVMQALARLRGEFMTAAEIKARPRLRSLVDGLLYRNTLARINGATGHGKTFVTLDLAGRVAAGLSWAGRRTHAGRVVYMVAEGTEGIADRIEAWETHAEHDMNVIFLPRPLQMLGPEWDLFVQVLVEDPPVLVVIDTQARATVGVDEIDRAEQSELVAAADRLRERTGACVLLVHHRGLKGEHGRGHTEIKGALQTELGCRKEGSVITVDNGKSKDDPELTPIVFDLKTVKVSGQPDENGVIDAPADAAVAVWRDDSMAALLERGAEPGEKLETVRARALWNLIYADYNPGDGGLEGIIRTACLALPVFAGLSSAAAQKAWRRAWNDLVQRGLIIRMWGQRRFKVMVLTKTGQDGVLTANRDEYHQDAPDGWEVYEPGAIAEGGPE